MIPFIKFCKFYVKKILMFLFIKIKYYYAVGDDCEYKTIQQAIDAGKRRILLKSDVWISKKPEGVKISMPKGVTIDMNGHSFKLFSPYL